MALQPVAVWRRMWEGKNIFAKKIEILQIIWRMMKVFSKKPIMIHATTSGRKMYSREQR